MTALEEYIKMAQSANELDGKISKLTKLRRGIDLSLSTSLNSVLIEAGFLAGVTWQYTTIESDYIKFEAIGNTANLTAFLSSDDEYYHTYNLMWSPDHDYVILSLVTGPRGIYLEIHADHTCEIIRTYNLHNINLTTANFTIELIQETLTHLNNIRDTVNEINS